jgi:short subunit dehydrogenase-like uncharacterized protein
VDDARHWVLYGATGFTGRLILARALDLGLRPVIAGRSPDKVAELAREHGLEHVAARVHDAGALTRMLRGRSLVLNAAGPFGETAVPMMEACLSTGTRYVDIGGDVSVLQKQLALAEPFRQKGIAAVLAVGFDVVPTDYAARWMALDRGRLITGADEIQLGLSLPMSMSRGSLKATVDELHQGTLILRNGVLERVRPLHHTAFFDYGNGPIMSLANTWGDLLTAPLTTGIRNVAIYFEGTPEVRQAARLSELLGGLARWKAVRSILKRLVHLLPEGPDDRARTSRQATIVAHLLCRGEVIRRTCIRTGDPYEFTAASAASAVQRLIAARDIVGVQTPASVLGDDFLCGLPGVSTEPPVWQ